jgi:hypothetical protein
VPEQAASGGLVEGYEQLRSRVLTGRPDGWRLGWGVLAHRGVAAWITAWTTTATSTREGTAAANAQAAALSAPRQEGGQHPAACSSLPSATTTEIITVLTAMTLAQTQAAPKPLLGAR